MFWMLQLASMVSVSEQLGVFALYRGLKRGKGDVLLLVEPSSAKPLAAEHGERRMGIKYSATIAVASRGLLQVSQPCRMFYLLEGRGIIACYYQCWAMMLHMLWALGCNVGNESRPDRAAPTVSEFPGRASTGADSIPAAATPRCLDPGLRFAVRPQPD